jgi:RNA polymerase sigma-70 factor (ECF subfamily)
VVAESAGAGLESRRLVASHRGSDGFDELRKQARRGRHERWPAPVRRPPTPEEIHSATQEQDRVRTVLGGIARRHAELLVLRSQGFNYEELAATLELNPASVGTLLSRAQQAFRKEYLKRYGEA